MIQEKVMDFTNNLNTKQWYDKISEEYYAKQDKQFGILVLSINETLKIMAEEITSWLQQNIHPHLHFRISLYEKSESHESECDVSIGYLFKNHRSRKTYRFSIYDYETEDYFNGTYEPVKKMIQKCVEKVNEQTLKDCEEYQHLIIGAEEKGYEIWKIYSQKSEEESLFSVKKRKIHITGHITGFRKNKEEIIQKFEKLINKNNKKNL